MLTAVIFSVAVAATPTAASAQPPADGAGADPTHRGPYARVGLGFGVGDLHEEYGALSLGLAWHAALGWHVTPAVAVHLSGWGSHKADGWGSWAYDDPVFRSDTMAIGAGATLRLRNGMFVATSAGAAFLRAREGFAHDHAVHWDRGLGAILRAGYDWLGGDGGPAPGVSVGAGYLHALTHEGRWQDHGIQVDFSVSIATR